MSTAAHSSVEPPLSTAQRFWLASILAAAFTVRLLYLLQARRTPGYVWEDPDGYMGQALRLADPEGWRWTFDAVTYSINQQHHALPPMYSVFLSFFAGFPGFPLTAQLAQVVLAVAAVWLVFAVGSYTRRAPA